MKRTAIPFAAVAAAAAAAVAIPAVSQSQTSGERTLTLTARTTSVKVVDLPPRRKSSSGDVLVSITRLSADGRRVGTGHLSCGVTRGSGTFEGATYQCAGTQQLRDGTITFAGVAKLGSARVIRIAVTGGTGAYDGVTGEVVNTATSENVSTQTYTLRD
jgi:hypothetical protein